MYTTGIQYFTFNYRCFNAVISTTCGVLPPYDMLLFHLLASWTHAIRSTLLPSLLMWRSQLYYTRNSKGNSKSNNKCLTRYPHTTPWVTVYAPLCTGSKNVRLTSCSQMSSRSAKHLLHTSGILVAWSRTRSCCRWCEGGTRTGSRIPSTVDHFLSTCRHRQQIFPPRQKLVRASPVLFWENSVICC